MITAFFSVCSESCTKHLHFASFAQFGNWVLPNNAVLSCLVVLIPACWQVENLTKFKMISTKNSSSHNNDRLDCMLLGRKACYHNLYPLVAFETLKGGFFYLFQTCKVDTSHKYLSSTDEESRTQDKQVWSKARLAEMHNSELGFWGSILLEELEKYFCSRQLKSTR